LRTYFVISGIGGHEGIVYPQLLHVASVVAELSVEAFAWKPSDFIEFERIYPMTTPRIRTNINCLTFDTRILL
jgi:hypothetical protein